MRTKRRTTIDDLRLAIDCLPRSTRAAMLEGLDAERIIAGAYAHRGGICPMLAAHRRGGRTNLISFARAWDRFVFGGARVNGPRPATARQLLVLRSHLEASLLAEEVPDCDLAAAAASHRELVARRRALERPGAPATETGRRQGWSGDRDRARELDGEPGWSWMRVVRSYDDYRGMLAGTRAAREASDREPILAD